MAAPPTGSAALPPPGLQVRLAPEVRVREGGLLLAGGAPFRLLRLSPTGAAVVARWRGGDSPATIGEDAGARALARRLLDAGILDALPEPAPALGDVALVVPVHGRPAQLERCLAALTASVGGTVITVVDDGSPDPDAIARIAAAHGARLVRHAANRGPAAARNSGLAATSAPLVVFVDSDVVVGPDATWLPLLVAQLADPRVGAAAPRVLHLHAPAGLLAGYEARCSSLDMGARGGTVAPGRWIPYVPSTVVAVRRDAVPDGGFDPSLRVGEDVDLVWRMHRDGWLVVYDPRAGVRHDHRVTPAALVARRRDYARSIAPLARRHPGAVAALRGDPGTLAAVALLALGRPRTAAATLALRTLRLRRQLDGRTRLALELAAAGTLGAAHGTGHAVRRTWSPLLLALALRRPRALIPLAAAALLPLLDPRRSRRPTDLALGLADDLLAAAGTWEGCVRDATLRPLLPAITRRG